MEQEVKRTLEDDLSLKLLYFEVARYMIKFADVNREIKTWVFKAKLGKNYHVRKELRDLIVKEIEQLGFIERINRDVIKIVLPEREVQLHKMSRVLGLY